MIWLAAAMTAALSLGPVSTVDMSPVVRTDHGAVRGIAHSDMTTFRGIPFAAPPTGRLRWRAPQPARPWPGIRNATENGPNCVQDSPDSMPGPQSDDCLYLSVT